MTLRATLLMMMPLIGSTLVADAALAKTQAKRKATAVHARSGIEAWHGVGTVIASVLNLRAGPGTNTRDIGNIPRGTRLPILARTQARHIDHYQGAYRWYEVRFGGKTGWVWGAYIIFGDRNPPSLHPPKPAPHGPAPAGYPSYSASRGARLASVAYARHHGNVSHHMCLAGVEDSLRHSILSPGYHSGQPGASQFGAFAMSHPRTFAGLHLAVRAANRAPRPSSYPRGTIMVFSRGRCGFNPTWGHVEVVVNGDVACSDFCRRRTDSRCAPSEILYPTN